MSNFNYRNFTELDYENIKESLKSYLKQQDEFKDYNFEGSAINQLLNVLAYNTQYNAFYLNMHSSERFIGTAQRRENVVQIARNLGYVPLSSKGSFAFLNVELTPQVGFVGNTITIPKDTIFTSKVDDTTYTFYTENTIVINRDITNGKFIANDVKIFEGKFFTFNYVFRDNDTGFRIPNSGVDTDTNKLRVTVKDNVNDTAGIVYNQSNRTNMNFTRLDSSSNVFFLEEVAGEKFRIYFGDNVIGSKPVGGQIVFVEYYTNSGSASNGANQFSLSSSIPNVDNLIITNSPVSAGGQNIEPIESIRVNAPLAFDSQNRAVTARDYEAIVYQIFPQAFSVSAWGGEDEVPERLGYVFMSIVKQGFTETDILSDSDKIFIETELRNNYSPISILPAVVDPKYTYIKIKSNVKFDSSIINPGESQLKANVISNIFNYGLDNYSKFNSTLRYSNIVTEIDNVDNSIRSNDTDLQVYGEQKFKANLLIDGFIDIGVSIERNTLKSSFFTYLGFESYFTDIGAADGQINMRRINNLGVDELAITNVASVDYNIGLVTFNNNINLNNIIYNQFIPLRITADPMDRDITFVFNRIPILRQSDIEITIRDINV